MLTPDEISIRASLEFELYISEINALAAEGIGVSASDFLDLLEQNKSIPMPFSPEEFRAMLKEAFLNGFMKGSYYTTESE